MRKGVLVLVLVLEPMEALGRGWMVGFECEYRPAG
jgi:hypothetical protein